MLRNAYLKSVLDLRRPIVWWSLGLFLYAFVIVLIYPSFQDIPELNDILGDEGSLIRAFTGNVDDFASPEGFLTAEMLSFTFPLLFIVFNLWLGTSWLAGEERRGSLEVLLSHPVHRTTMLLQKFGAMVSGTAALAVVVFIGTLAGVVIVDMDISLLNVIQAYIGLALLGITFGALALLVGAWTGKPSATVGVGGAVGIAAYVANTFGPIVDGLEWTQYLSPIYYFIGGNPMVNGLNLIHSGVLIGASVVLVAAASYLFERRDLAV
ncbi:MAG: ABC transporter permease subunit [Dehalococcoidia bacterium]|nr:ABC transporter permease subunit [Dehalococcoidia bacterium]